MQKYKKAEQGRHGLPIRNAISQYYKVNMKVIDETPEGEWEKKVPALLKQTETDSWYK